MTEKLAGKVAIVTGASGGLGRAAALALAREGAFLALTGRSITELSKVAADIAACGGVGKTFVADLCSLDDIQGLVADVLGAFGQIDVLVNNAGVSGPDKPFLSIGPVEWDAVLSSNLRGPAFLSQAVARHMVERAQGRIINIASIGGIAAISKLGPYGASKAGLIHLTKVMALELAQHNVLVNVVCPGWFLSPMNRDFLESEAAQKMIHRAIPLRRLGDSAEEVAPMIVYLASSAAGFMTGSVVVIDGGQTVA